jgi:aminoglycoside phosphotransferase (APT) family kinase protein
VNAAAAAAAIDAQFPELAPASVRYLGEGYDSVAFDVNEHWVFRFPKHGDAETLLAVELAIVPALAGRLPIAIPDFRFLGQPATVYPRSFAGYRKLPGIPGILFDPSLLPLTRIASQLGRFLACLHTVPLDDPALSIAPRENAKTEIADARAEALDEFRHVRDAAAPGAPLDAWRAFLEAGVTVAAFDDVTEALVHNDFALEHVLLDETTFEVTAIIDWSDMAIADPANDFMGAFHWGGEPFFTQLAAAYGRPIRAGARERARFLAACRGVYDVSYGIRLGLPEYVSAGLRALALCAGAARSGGPGA